MPRPAATSTPDNEDQLKLSGIGSRPGEFSASYAAAPGAPDSSPRPSTYCRPARHNQDGKGSVFKSRFADHPPKHGLIVAVAVARRSSQPSTQGDATAATSLTPSPTATSLTPSPTATSLTPSPTSSDSTDSVSPSEKASQTCAAPSSESGSPAGTASPTCTASPSGTASASATSQAVQALLVS
jgi:hypothetical protein